MLHCSNALKMKTPGESGRFHFLVEAAGIEPASENECFDLAGEYPHRQGSFTDQPCGSRPDPPAVWTDNGSPPEEGKGRGGLSP